MALNILQRCVATVFISITSWANADAEDNARGENIYHTGALTTPYVTLKKQQAQAPSALFPCVNCHGRRGEGKKESGVVAPDITWFQLTQHGRADTEGGRARPPYTLQSLRVALERGLGSDGKPLSSVMPRYTLSPAELNALVDYLKTVDQRIAPGVDERSIRLAVRLPEPETQAQAMTQALTAYTQSLNNQGGIYGRQLALNFLAPGQPSSLENDFLLLDCRLPSEPRRASEYPDDLPVFALFAPSDEKGASRPHFNNHHFALYDVERFAEQALREYALANNLLVETEYRQRPDHTAQSIQKIAATAQKAKREQAILLDDQHLSQFLATPRSNGHGPTLLITGSAVATIYSELVSYPGDIFIATAPTPYQADAIALRDYQQLAQNYPLPKNYLSEQLWSLSLIQLVTETLRVAGKDLLRESFIDSLVTQYEFTPHYGPTLRFSANKKVGAMGATITSLKFHNQQLDENSLPRWVSVREGH